MTGQTVRRVPSLLPYAILLSLALGTTATPALAFHTESEQLTDYTAFSERQNEWTLAPTRVRYGILDQLAVGTYTTPLIAIMPNLHVRGQIWNGDLVAVRLAAGFVYFNTDLIPLIGDDANQAKGWVLPAELMSSWKLHSAHLIHLGANYTYVMADGALRADSYEGVGGAAAENLQLVGTYEFRLTKVTAFQLRGRLQAYQAGGGDASAEVQVSPSQSVTLTGAAGSGEPEFKGAYSVEAGVAWSWEHLNLELGAGYGHYNVPMLNFMTERRGFFPTFDIYWRL